MGSEMCIRDSSEAWRQFQLSTNANQAIQIAKDLTDRLKIYEDKYQAVGSKILALGKAYNSSVSSYNARLKPFSKKPPKITRSTRRFNRYGKCSCGCNAGY